ncbi:hypothetical protein [Paenibacillus illinoisensis]|nr:hypothetical protein [Paenibacillus illinoisensis]MCM3205649.1 hypothetical protein [Paenibacillus illinoisensis]
MAYKFERTPTGYSVRTAPTERIEREQAARDWAAMAIVVAGLIVVWTLI